MLPALLNSSGALGAYAHALYNFLLTLVSCATLASVHLVERRGRHKSELNPARQIEISTLIESMPEAVLIFDQSGAVIEANSAAGRLFHVTDDEIERFTASEVARYIAPRGQEPSPDHQVVNRALRGETVQQERRTISLPAVDSALEVLVSANPIRDVRGSVVGALIIVRDVTELTVLQSKMADAERHNAVGKMAAGLAHDFNNVLDTISQAVSVMEVDPNRSPEERQLIARMIRNAVRRGSEIVGGIRKFLSGSRDEHMLDVNQLLEESIELTRPLWHSTRNVSIRRLFQPVPKVCADATELRRVFTNLIINSLEAMPTGGVLTVGCERADLKVVAFVQDTGEGIPEDKKRYIFAPYFTTKEGGTGLGLASAERSVRAQHGEISFNSREGEGTRFCIELPAATEDVKKTA